MGLTYQALTKLALFNPLAPAAHARPILVESDRTAGVLIVGAGVQHPRNQKPGTRNLEPRNPNPVIWYWRSESWNLKPETRAVTSSSSPTALLGCSSSVLGYPRHPAKFVELLYQS